MDFAEKIVTTKVTAEMLIMANEAVSALGEKMRARGEKPDFIAVFMTVADVFGGDRNIVPAIYFRMQATSKLIKERSLSKWTIEVRGQEHVLVPEALFSAIAAAPLLPGSGNEFVFDPEVVLHLALQFSEEGGTG